jgi:hypothetical protein
LGISTTTPGNKQADVSSPDIAKEAPAEITKEKSVKVMEKEPVKNNYKTFPITVKGFVSSYNKRLRASGLASFTIKAPETIRGGFFDAFAIPLLRLSPMS